MDFHFNIKPATGTLASDRVCSMEEDNNSSVTATTMSFRGIYNATLPSSTTARISHHRPPQPSQPQPPQVDEPVRASQWFHQIPPSILEDGRTEDDDISVSTETSGMAAPMDTLSPWAALLEAVYAGTLTDTGFVSERPPNNGIREHESTTRQPKRKSETYSSSTKRLRKW
jgi:hypothetical protein